MKKSSETPRAQCISSTAHGARARKTIKPHSNPATIVPGLGKMLLRHGEGELNHETEPGSGSRLMSRRMAEQNSTQAVELRAAVFAGDDKAKVAARRAAGILDERRIDTWPYQRFCPHGIC